MGTQTACAMRNSLAQRQNHKFLQTLRAFLVHFFIFGCAESLAAGYFYVRNSLKLLGAFLAPTIKSGHKFIKDLKKKRPKTTANLCAYVFESYKKNREFRVAA